LRQAIAECCERGLLVQRWGKGIFTAEKPAEISAPICCLRNDTDFWASPVFHIRKRLLFDEFVRQDAYGKVRVARGWQILR
jgi:DNA-binding GntR family transcriptional regulator